MFGPKMDVVGGNFIIRSFVICILREVLLECTHNYWVLEVFFHRLVFLVVEKHDVSDPQMKGGEDTYSVVPLRKS
jgi:hypothetical protein